MNPASSLKCQLRARAVLAPLAMVVVYAISIALVIGADTKAPETKPPAKKPEAKQEKATVKKLTGAELYALHCNRCHPERYATEWNAGQWKTLMTHMRVRANLPASQAKLILKYLQEDSGN